MDYLCAKLASLVSAVLVLSCGQTDRITYRRMIAILGEREYHNDGDDAV